jgi:hypothetical protein
MGTSNTIDQQSKLNAQFQDYINTQTANLNQMIKTGQDDIKSMIDQHYKDSNITDATPLTYGTYQHLTTVSEWNLDSVTKMISAINNAVFGLAPTPPSDNTKGNQVTLNSSTASALAQNVKNTSEMILLIESAAFNAINGILSTIDYSTQTSIQKQTATKEIAPGLTLFVCIIENVYSKQDFLSGQSIVQNGYIFDSRYSLTEGAKLAQFDTMQSLIDEQNAMTNQAAKLSTVISNLDPASSTYMTSFQTYTTMINTINDAAEALLTKINALK